MRKEGCENGRKDGRTEEITITEERMRGWKEEEGRKGTRKRGVEGR